MGNRESVVVLKEGDWVVDNLGNVLQVDKVLNNHIFIKNETGFYLLEEVVKVDPAIYPILSDSI